MKIKKRSKKMKFLANKIYYNFSQENPKISNIQDPQMLDSFFKNSKYDNSITLYGDQFFLDLENLN